MNDLSAHAKFLFFFISIQFVWRLRKRAFRSRFSLSANEFSLKRISAEFIDHIQLATVMLTKCLALI